MKFNKCVGPNNRVGRNFSKSDKCLGLFRSSFKTFFNLESNIRMKMHEKMHYWSNYNEKRLPKALKIDKKVKFGAQ